MTPTDAIRNYISDPESFDRDFLTRIFSRFGLSESDVVELASAQIPLRMRRDFLEAMYSPEVLYETMSMREATDILRTINPYGTAAGEFVMNYYPREIVDNEIIIAMGGSAFAIEWARVLEYAGHNFSDMDIITLSNEMPRVYLAWAWQVYEKITRLNAGRTPAQALADLGPDFDDEAGEFGYGIIMPIVGHGVRWEDDHPPHGLILPHLESPFFVPCPEEGDYESNPLVCEQCLEDIEEGSEVRVCYRCLQILCEDCVGLDDDERAFCGDCFESRDTLPELMI